MKLPMRKAIILLAIPAMFWIAPSALASEDPESLFISQIESLEDLVYHESAKAEVVLSSRRENAEHFSAGPYLKYASLLAESMFYNGKYEASFLLIDEALSTYEGDKSTEYYFDGLASYSYIASSVRGLDTLSQMEAAYAIAQQMEDKEKLAVISEMLGFYHLQKANLVSSYNYIAEAGQIFEAGNDDESKMNNKLSMSQVLIQMGLFDEAVNYLTEAIAYYQTRDNHYSLTIAYELMGLILARKKDFDKAYTFFDNAIAASIEGGVPHLKVTSVVMKARIYERWEEYEKGLSLLEALEEEMGEESDVSNPVMMLTAKAELLRGVGRLPESIALIEEVELFLAKEGSLRVRMADLDIRYARARYKELSGDSKAAVTAYWLYVDLLETLLTRRTNAFLTEIAMQYEADKREAEHVRLTHEKEKNRLILTYSEKERFRQVIFATLSTLLCIGLLGFLYLQVRSRRRLAFLASYDSLTEALNRRAIMLLGDKIKMSRRAEDYSVILMDIDKFKSINDKFGHDVGDSVLRAFAKVCGEAVRIDDHFGRFGGEEFVAVLPATNKADALLVAQRIQKSLSSFNWACTGVDYPVTASLGVATASRDASQSFSDTLNQADQAMYYVKNNGRNNVCHFNDTHQRASI